MWFGGLTHQSTRQNFDPPTRCTQFQPTEKRNKMTRISPINRTAASGKTQKLLDGAEKKLGMVPNMIATMAQSHAVAGAYLGFSQALSVGAIAAPLREQIALTVSQINGCGYCLAAHSAIGNSIGLTDDEVRDARSAQSPDRKTEAALQFARHVVDQRGGVSDAGLTAVRDAGYSDSEVLEIIAHVALNTLTNYVNKTAQTEVDFPPVAELVGS
jgi:uncharacterized peroxidase-related enzyme